MILAIGRVKVLSQISVGSVVYLTGPASVGSEVVLVVEISTMLQTPVVNVVAVDLRTNKAMAKSAILATGSGKDPLLQLYLVRRRFEAWTAQLATTDQESERTPRLGVRVVRRTARDLQERSSLNDQWLIELLLPPKQIISGDRR